MDRHLHRQIMRPAARVVFIHKWNVNLAIGWTARICKAEITFAFDRLAKEISEMQRVDQRRGMFKLAIGARHGGLAKRLNGVTAA